MILIERVEVMNLGPALRGMRNPMNSWDKSDTRLLHVYNPEGEITGNPFYEVGEKDFALAKGLVASGSDHSKFMRQIFVSMDITAPEYWWKEYETYQVGTTENSTSTMHKLGSRNLTVEDFSLEDIRSDYAVNLVQGVNAYIQAWRENKSEDRFRRMIQVLPMSYNYLRTCTLNYQVLRNMYHARKAHKLREWREFCEWIKTLPISELITMESHS